MNPFLWLRVAALCSLAILSAVADDSRAQFLKLLDRPRVALAPELEELPATNGVLRFRFSFASEPDQRVPGVLMKAEGSTGKRPAVIALHGTGGSKANLFALSRKLAEKGFVAVAIDGRYHGDRTKSGKGAAEYNDAIIRAWRQPGEHPFYYDTVWDVMRLLDYLQTRDDIDPARIGVIGFSKGGIETYLAAAIDPRVAVAVPCIGVQSFRWGLDHNAWKARVNTIETAFSNVVKEARVEIPDAAFVRAFYDRVVPGIYSQFDGPVMVPLIAPRPLLMINGDSDANTPLAGVQECIEAAQKAYRAANAEDHFAVRIQEKTGHQVKPESEQAAIEWFVKWLKP